MYRNQLFRAGELIVRPGSIVHLDCIQVSRFPGTFSMHSCTLYIVCTYILRCTRTVADTTDLKVHRVYLYFFAFPSKKYSPTIFFLLNLWVSKNRKQGPILLDQVLAVRVNICANLFLHPIGIKPN